MRRKFWWPRTLSEQHVLVQNFRSKIGGYAAQLGLTAAEVAEAEEWCDAIIGAYTLAENSRMTMIAMTQWRDRVFNGDPVGTDAPPPPIFPSGGTPAFKVGSVKLFFQLRDKIVSSNGYTIAIGEDLGIVGAEDTARPAGELTPDLKAIVSNGNFVNLKGSMQGMDALRVEYQRIGEQFTTIAFLTNTPGGFQITPAAPGQPEVGYIRAVFIKKNQQVGNFSPAYQVTVS